MAAVLAADAIDWSRLLPVGIVVGAFAVVGYLILPGGARPAAGRREQDYVQLTVCEYGEDAVALAAWLRERGVPAVACRERGEHDSVRPLAVEKGEPRSVVAVPPGDRESARELLLVYAELRTAEALPPEPLPIQPGDEFDPPRRHFAGLADHLVVAGTLLARWAVRIAVLAVLCALLSTLRSCSG